MDGSSSSGEAEDVSGTTTSGPDTQTAGSADATTDTTADTTTATEPDCGNGIVDDGEECDDGNDDESDGCTSLCMPPSCSDGILSGDETDVDCGGGCDGCGDGLACIGDGDCSSSNCYTGGCVAACTGWLGQYGTVESEDGQAIVVDDSGDVYVAGITRGGMDGNVNLGGYDMYFSKFAPDGTREYTRQIGSTSDDYNHGLDVDADGNVVIAGSVLGAMDGNVHLGTFDGGVAMYDANTTLLWSRQLGTPQVDRIEGVAFDSEGKVYVGGMTLGSYGPHTNAGSGDLWLVKLNEDGSEVWSVQMGDAGLEIIYGLTVAANDDVIGVGYALGGFDGHPALGGDDGIVARFDPDGVLQWSTLLGGPSSEELIAVAEGPSGEIVVTGWATGSYDGQPHAGALDIIVSKLSADGVLEWSQQIGTSNDDFGRGVAVDAEGTIYIAGHTQGDLDGNINQGENDLVLIALEPDGQTRWIQVLGTPEGQSAADVAIGAEGQLYMTGGSVGDLGGMAAGEADLVVGRVCDPRG